MKLNIELLLRLEKTNTIEQISDMLNVTEGAIRKRLRAYYNVNRIPTPAHLNKPKHPITQVRGGDGLTAKQRDFYQEIVSYTKRYGRFPPTAYLLRFASSLMVNYYLLILIRKGFVERTASTVGKRTVYINYRLVKI